MADAERWGVADRVHVTGYVAGCGPARLSAAADICACLRWPTNRETSASWLRCLAAGRATIVTELSRSGGRPDARSARLRLLDTSPTPREPIAVSIDVVDEEHSLQLVARSSRRQRRLRARLGTAARAWWAAHHQLAAMARRLRARDRAGGIAPRAATPAPGPSDADGHARHARDRRRRRHQP